jgi:hypothetical protein
MRSYVCKNVNRMILKEGRFLPSPERSYQLSRLSYLPGSLREAAEKGSSQDPGNRVHEVDHDHGEEGSMLDQIALSVPQSSNLLFYRYFSRRVPCDPGSLC